MRQRLRSLPTRFRRYMYDVLPENARMVGLIGPRGVGKSTLILQKVNHSLESSLYVDADNLYFSNHTLVDLADDFVKQGGSLLAIDEIHKYKGWSKELKQIYDNNPELRVLFTGSSVLDIKKGEADLSRRALMYEMQGLSFREYLDLRYEIKVDTYSLEEVLTHKVNVENIQHPLPYFHEYLKKGYFPFFNEPEYDLRINQIVSQTVETDIPMFAEMKIATARKLKQLLAVLSSLAPYKPNLERLSVEVGVSRNNLPDYLVWLEKAGMIALLRDDTSGMRALGKVGKVYVDNPNFLYGLAGAEAEIGSVRETFFQNQTRVVSAVYASRKADFRIGDYTIEIGGKSKGQRQIEGVANGFIIKDDIEFGVGNIIPLWHFGLLY